MPLIMYTALICEEAYTLQRLRQASFLHTQIGQQEHTVLRVQAESPHHAWDGYL